MTQIEQKIIDAINEYVDDEDYNDFCESQGLEVEVETDGLYILVEGSFSKTSECVFSGDYYSPAEYRVKCDVKIDEVKACNEDEDVRLDLNFGLIEYNCCSDTIE